MYEMHVPGSLYDPEAHKRHEQSGSKISLLWDASGTEWLVDGYIQKYFSNVEKIVESAKRLEVGSPDLGRALQICLELQEFSADWGNKNPTTVKKMDQLLIELQQIFKEGDANTSAIKALIDQTIALSKASIDKNSVNPVCSGIKITASPAEQERAIDPRVLVEIASPVLTMLGQITETADRPEVDKTCTAFVQSLAAVARQHLQQERRMDFEILISRFLKQILTCMVDEHLSPSDKMELIEHLKKMIERELNESLVLGSPKLTGAVEGLGYAGRVGGLTAVRHGFEAVSRFAKGKEAVMKGIQNQLDAFVNASFSYLVGSGIVSPVRTALVEKLPKSTTDVERTLKRDCLDFLKLLSESSMEHLKKGETVEFESRISEYLKNIVSSLAPADERSVEEKAAIIDHMKLLVEKEVYERVLSGSPQLIGLLEKFRNPDAFGGDAAVRAETASLSDPLKERLSLALAIQDQLGKFTQSAKAYIEMKR
jgi:hypothetical protein